MTMWGGRFEGRVDSTFDAVNRSLGIDYRLAQEDIRGSRAWAKALRRAAVLTEQERTSIDAALMEIAEQTLADPELPRHASEEDIHSWVEARLIERIGETGKKLHTGRSRNDQVATDLRLWAVDAITLRRTELRGVMTALVGLAGREAETPFPGYTHLQRAQPLLFGHWCLAYYEMFKRDDARLRDAALRANRCPLGSAALAGTTYPIDRDALASALGFDGPTANSLDGVSARDFVVESLSAIALLGLHLSRIAEDLVFYCSGEAGLVELSEAMTSGSSLMPQKQNPDALELLRGKSGRLLGNLVTMAVTLKGLPLAYNKDLQEDKSALFDAHDNLGLCLRVLAPMLDGVRVRHDVAKRAAVQSHSNATEFADHLVANGVAFRDAHHQVGLAVRHAIGRGCALEELSLEELRQFAPSTADDVAADLTLEAMLAKRDVLGGTAPRRVLAAIARARDELSTVFRAHVAPAQARLSLSGPQVRPAQVRDLDAIASLVGYWADQGENLPRGRDEIVAQLPGFSVVVDDDKVVGCASLAVYSEVLAEIRSLGLDPAYQSKGFGRRLTEHVVGHARALGIPEVFVLTRAPEFFARLGFRKVGMDSLPGKVWRDCMSCPRRHRCDETPMVLGRQLGDRTDEASTVLARPGAAIAETLRTDPSAVASNAIQTNESAQGPNGSGALLPIVR